MAWGHIARVLSHRSDPTWSAQWLLPEPSLSGPPSGKANNRLTTKWSSDWENTVKWLADARHSFITLFPFPRLLPVGEHLVYMTTVPCSPGYLTLWIYPKD
jgi:hypothetical protein